MQFEYLRLFIAWKPLKLLYKKSEIFIRCFSLQSNSNILAWYISEKIKVLCFCNYNRRFYALTHRHFDYPIQCFPIVLCKCPPKTVLSFQPPLNDSSMYVCTLPTPATRGDTKSVSKWNFSGLNCFPSPRQAAIPRLKSPVYPIFL